MRTSQARVLVIGSLNVDYIASVDRLPRPGETVAATGLVQRFGGKGANQAVAAARQGAAVAMIGCVGADATGRAYLARLRDENIDVGGISTTRRAPTGVALIAVDRTAENNIIVAAGANGELTPSSIKARRAQIAKARVVLLQFEVPMAVAHAATRIANRAGVPVLLNPSPLKPGFDWGLCQVDTLLVNGGEAEVIFGRPVVGLPKEPDPWRRGLAKRRISRLIITRGPKPTLCLTAAEYFEVPTITVRPVDTVGAGDAFAGALAAALAEGRELRSAICRANCAGALATLKSGAQEAIPTRAATVRAARTLAAAIESRISR